MLIYSFPLVDELIRLIFMNKKGTIYKISI